MRIPQSTFELVTWSETGLFGLPGVAIGYRLKSELASRTEHVVEVLLMNGTQPYRVQGVGCEESVEIFGADVVAMLQRFVVRKLPPPTATPIPTVTPTAAPIAPTPPPILTAATDPFSCSSSSGVVVTEVSSKISYSGIVVDVSGRITNTCNRPITVHMTAIAYRQNGTILGSERYRYGIYGLKMNPGQSQVLTIIIVGSGYEETAYVAIEARYER